MLSILLSINKNCGFKSRAYLWISLGFETSATISISFSPARILLIPSMNSLELEASSILIGSFEFMAMYPNCMFFKKTIVVYSVGTNAIIIPAPEKQSVSRIFHFQIEKFIRI